MVMTMMTMMMNGDDDDDQCKGFLKVERVTQLLGIMMMMVAVSLALGKKNRTQRCGDRSDGSVCVGRQRETDERLIQLLTVQPYIPVPCM